MKTQTFLLVDAIGAWTSAVAMLLLAKFESVFGLPATVAIALFCIAVLYALCSFAAYLFSKQKAAHFLKVMAFANMLYGALSLGVFINCFQRLTVYGRAYFIIELLVILALVYFEWKQTQQL